MKMYKYIFPTLLSGVMLFSCTTDFDEINTNPNGPTDVPATLLIPSLVEGNLDQLYSPFIGGDMGSCWAQHWSKVDYNDEERYRPRSTQFNVIWNGLYAGSGGGGALDAQIMYTKAVAENNKNLQGIALIMKAYSVSVLTDMFGDVPYTESIRAGEGINTPKYDRQEDIYPALLALLDQANSLFGAENGSITASSDILYAGDYSKWQKFSNALKFRMLMRISNRADFNRQAELQEIVDNREIFAANTDEAKLIYLAAAPNDNPVYATIVSGGRGEFKINSALVDRLAASSDPRLPVYAQVNNGGIYRGKPAGLNNVPSATWGYANVSPIGALYLKATAPGVFMSYAEQEFLIAEAAQRGLITGGDALAATHFNNGVNASMSSNEIATADATAYLANHPYNAATGNAQIQTEKWIALYGQGVEAWTEWRRTGIPALTPAIDGAVNEIPSRYTYPPQEQALNGKNYSAAVTAQGPDLLTTKIWWMK